MCEWRLRRSHRARRKVWSERAVALAVTTCAFTTPPIASAAPMREFPIEGVPAQDIMRYVGGPSGSMWFLQTWVGTASGSSGDQMRIGRVRQDGTPEFALVTPGNANFSSIVSTPDGSAFVVGSNGRTVDIVSPNGALNMVSLPPGFSGRGRVVTLTAGADGSAWMLGCTTGGCTQVVRISPAGTVDVRPIPALSEFGQINAFVQSVRTVATSSGIWFSSAADGSTPTIVDFVPFDGEVSTLQLPAGAAITAPAGGADVLWAQEASPHHVGRASPAGQISEVQALPLLPTSPMTTFFHPFPRLYPGHQPGVLLWTKHIGSAELDGQLGIVANGAPTTVYNVSNGKTALPTESQTSFTGTCEFGTTAIQAIDGAIWLSHHPAGPPRLSRLSADGEFRTFTVASLANDNRGSIGDAVESSDGMLWFAISGGGGARDLRARIRWIRRRVCAHSARHLPLQPATNL